MRFIVFIAHKAIKLVLGLRIRHRGLLLGILIMIASILRDLHKNILEVDKPQDGLTYTGNEFGELISFHLHGKNYKMLKISKQRKL